MRVYKAIQESVWPKYTLYVCVRPGVRPGVLPARVCGQVCCQMVCAARNMVFLVKVVTFWMILERILSPCFEEM